MLYHLTHFIFSTCIKKSGEYEINKYLFVCLFYAYEVLYVICFIITSTTEIMLSPMSVCFSRFRQKVQMTCTKLGGGTGMSQERCFGVDPVKKADPGISYLAP